MSVVETIRGLRKKSLADDERAKWARKSSGKLEWFALVASQQLVDDEEKYRLDERAMGKKAQQAHFQLGKALAVVRFNDDASIAEAKARGWGDSVHQSQLAARP